MLRPTRTWGWGAAATRNYMGQAGLFESGSICLNFLRLCIDIHSSNRVSPDRMNAIRLKNWRGIAGWRRVAHVQSWGRSALSCLTAMSLVVFLPRASADGEVPADGATPTAEAVEVLETLRHDLGARSILYQRVAPPPSTETPAVPASTPPAELSPEIQEMIQRREGKRQATLFLSATVYDHQVTEIRWFDADPHRTFRAFSNIDFNHLAGLMELETADTVYWVFFGLGNETLEDVEAANRYATENGLPAAVRQIPARETFSAARAEYRLAQEPSDPAPPASILAALDDLHRHFDAHRAELAETYAAREAARLEHEARVRENPPVPQDTVIQLWPVRSTNYPTAPSGGQP